MSQSNKLLSTGIIVAIAVVLTALVTYAVVSENTEPAAAPEQTTTEQQPASNPPAETEESTQTTPDASSDAISMEDAERIAVERFGGTVTESKQDTHNDQPTWEIEMTGTSEGKIEVDVHRQTGEIIAWERD